MFVSSVLIQHPLWFITSLELRHDLQAETEWRCFRNVIVVLIPKTSKYNNTPKIWVYNTYV